MSSHARGFSLVEALVTLAVVSILVTIGLPGFAGTLADIRTQTSRHQLGADFAFARSSAVTRRQSVVVCADDGQQQCARSRDWSNGWIVFVDADRNGQLGAKDTLLRVTHGPRLHRAHATRTMVRFQPDGRAAGTNLSVHLCRNRTQAGSVIVNNLGRVRTVREAVQSHCD